MSVAIQQKQIEEYKKQFEETPKKIAVQRGMLKNGILASSEEKENHSKYNSVFSIDLKTGDVSNQRLSGRCWMFAALNTFRHKIAKELKIKDFELSQNYTFFWDKFEKANFFYENILKTAEEDVDSRKVAFLLQTPQQDGGQWDMLVAIIKKYGIVPKNVMDETRSSMMSRELNTVLNLKLRKDAIELRKLVQEGKSDAELQEIKQLFLMDVFSILASALGTPPTQFNFEYRDSDNNYFCDENLTPHTFFEKYANIDLDNYVSIINAPTKDKPFNQLYTIEMLGNVIDGQEVRHLNVSMDTLKELAVKQLSQGESVWFGCDVGQSSDRKKGGLATDYYNIGDTLDVDFSMTKAERLEFGESMMTHAMVLTGVDIKNASPLKWKVENSWGEKVGDNGYFVMSDDWMTEFTYQVVIRKDLLSDELQDILNGEVTVLAPWDPMGALA